MARDMSARGVRNGQHRCQAPVFRARCARPKARSRAGSRGVSTGARHRFESVTTSERNGNRRSLSATDGRCLQARVPERVRVRAMRSSRVSREVDDAASASASEGRVREGNRRCPSRGSRGARTCSGASHEAVSRVAPGGRRCETDRVGGGARGGNRRFPPRLRRRAASRRPFSPVTSWFFVEALPAVRRRVHASPPRWLGDSPSGPGDTPLRAGTSTART